MTPVEMLPGVAASVTSVGMVHVVASVEVQESVEDWP